MERWLSQPSLAQVKLAFAGQKPLAQQTLGALQPFALHKFSVVCDQHVTDVIGIIDQEHRLRAELEIDQVAVPLGQLGQKFDWIAAECENTDTGENNFRAWWKN